MKIMNGYGSESYINKLNDVGLSLFYEGTWGKRSLPPLILILSTRRQMVNLMPRLFCPLTEQKAG
jgi:hypothetical protein